jgi:hypothetical protein
VLYIYIRSGPYVYNEESEIDSEAVEMDEHVLDTIILMQGDLVLTELPKDIEDWKNVKEINLMHNELSGLPENPSCPLLLALILHNNHKVKTIPPSFFDYMPALQILNLTRTGIKSLLESIVKLVNLKRLLLSYCYRFLRLSPNVRELKQLEVLDLEGTQILDLPKEIINLTNLTCLKFSIYGYMDDGCCSVMESDALVPHGVISALFRLEELMISVNPDDKRWNACVEDIVIEVCSLLEFEDSCFLFSKGGTCEVLSIE